MTGEKNFLTIVGSLVTVITPPGTAPVVVYSRKTTKIVLSVDKSIPGWPNIEVLKLYTEGRDCLEEGTSILNIEVADRDYERVTIFNATTGNKVSSCRTLSTSDLVFEWNSEKNDLLNVYAIPIIEY